MLYSKDRYKDVYVDICKGVIFMAGYFGLGNTSVSTLFSSLNTSSSLSGTTSMISDYYSIRNGSYKKLLNAYYSIDENKEKTKTSINTAKDSSKLLATIKESTDDLKSSADKLAASGKTSLFNQKEDGTYDVDKIAEAVKSFVDDYNSVIDDTKDSNSKNIASSSTSMITTTKANTALLKKIGITIDSKGKLSLDEDKLKTSNMNNVKTLFNGQGSYGYQISARASMINYYAGVESGKSNTYTNIGSYSYNYSAGDIFNQMY